MATTRPNVSVVLPFHGDAQEAEEALDALAGLDLQEGDEILVADNTEHAILVERAANRPVTAFATEVKRSAYAARNIAAERARNEWLLFLDADVRPPPDLLDRYFDPAPGAAEGAVAGQVLGDPEQHGVVPGYIRSRGHLDQDLLRGHPHGPMAVTANLLVRRSAWAAVGGFAEQTRSGADADFCWRLTEAGHALGYRSGALVHHTHRASLAALLRQSERDGAGERWLSRRYPGVPARPRLRRELPRALAGALLWTALAQPRRGLYKAIDGLYVLASTAGSFGSNAAPRTPVRAQTVAIVEEFPGTTEESSGSPQSIEARRRPVAPDWQTGRAVPVAFAEDEGPGVRARALSRLALARPVAVWRAISDRGLRGAAELAPAALRVAAGRPQRLTADDARRRDAHTIALLAGIDDVVTKG